MPSDRRERLQGYPPRTFLPWQEFFPFNQPTTEFDINTGNIVHQGESMITLQLNSERLKLKITLKPLGKVDLSLAVPPISLRIESVERLPLQDKDVMRSLYELAFQVNYRGYLYEARPDRDSLKEGTLVFSNFQGLNPETEIPPFNSTIPAIGNIRNPYAPLDIRNVSQIMGRFVSIGKLAAVNEMVAVLSSSNI